MFVRTLTLKKFCKEFAEYLLVFGALFGIVAWFVFLVGLAIADISKAIQ